MKAMFMTDFMMVKRYFKQQVPLYALIVTFIAITTGSLYSVTPFFGAMIPLALGFTLFALDERNNWEQFRLVLPLSRRQVILGRYASLAVVTAIGIGLGIVLAGLLHVIALMMPNFALLDGIRDKISFPLMTLTAILPAAIIFIMLAIVLPVVARLGMTKAVRFIPMVFALIFIAGFTVLGQAGDTLSTLLPFVNDLAALLDTATGPFIIAGVLLLVTGAIYVASSMLSVKLYQQREL